MKTKIAFFDFDKTVIDQDSIFLLYKKTLEEHKEYRPTLYTGMIKECFRFPKKKGWKKRLKSQFLQMLNLYTEEDMKNFVYQTLLQDHIFTQAIEKIYDLKEDGYHLILVTASVENYIKYVVDILSFDAYIGTKVDENYNILGHHNKRQGKVKNIRNYLLENNMEIDYEKSQAYSDSLADDGPMLELVKNKFLINNKYAPKGYQTLQWTIKNKI